MTIFQPLGIGEQSDLIDVPTDQSSSAIEDCKYKDAEGRLRD